MQLAVGGSLHNDTAFNLEPSCDSDLYIDCCHCNKLLHTAAKDNHLSFPWKRVVFLFELAMSCNPCSCVEAAAR
jgi:hypothetical protein